LCCRRLALRLQHHAPMSGGKCHWTVMSRSGGTNRTL
jgi:hypothetical protein